MASPVLHAADLSQPAYVRPTSVMMLRTPVPPSQGTDPYHDAFGPFCLPSFPYSALESGSSTPLPSMAMSGLTSTDRSGADLLRSALSASKPGRRKNRFYEEETSLTTHHLSPEMEDAIGPAVDGTDAPPKREYCVTSVTILGHRGVNIDKLCDRLSNGAESDGERGPYRGAIITSQRAVEAWAEAAQKLSESVRNGKECRTNWPRVPVFAVGPATAEALRAIAKQLILPLRPALVMGGGATGTGEALASYIIRHFNGPMGAAPGQEIDVAPEQPPLLYLTGDKNASTIADMLESSTPPVPHEDLMVYETSLHPTFSKACTQLSQSLPPAPASRPGSRRSSRAGSSSSSRRPSVGSLLAGGPGTNSPLTALQQQRNSSRDWSADGVTGGGSGGAAGSGTLGKGSLLGSSGPGLTAMTSIGAENADNAPTVSSPFEEIDMPLDTDVGLGTGSGTKPDWIVFFSPSGIQYALDDLRSRRWLPGPYTFDADRQEYAKESPESKRRREKWLSMGPPEGFPRLAVLGPTTKRWVRQNLGFQPDAVAASPGPTELREAIRMAEKRIRRERERLKGERDDAQRLERDSKARLVGVADGGGIPMEMD